MTRPTDHSFPGIGWALITTTSSSRRAKNRFSPTANRDRADIGSPCEPVEITHTCPGGSVSTRSISTNALSGISRMPSCRAKATFFCIERPRVATFRPPAMAASATCWTRWIWLAKQVTTNRRSGRARNTRRRVAPPVVADGNPGDLTGQSGLVHPVPGQTQSELGTVDVHRKITEQKRQPAGMIFVPVGQDDRVHPIGVLPQVGEGGKHQIDARHVRVGEHDAHVEDEDATVHLDTGAVPPDLTETTEEHDTDRSRSFGTHGDMCRRVRVRLTLFLIGALGHVVPVSYTHLRAHETGRNLVCRLLLEK